MLQRIFKELSALSPKPPAELKALAEQFEKKVYSNSPDPTAYKKDIENRLNDVKKRRDKQPRPAQPAPGQPPPAGQPLPQAPPQQPVPPPQPAPPQAPPPAAANPEQDLAKQQIQQKAQKFRKNLELLLTINQKERWDMLSRFLNLNLHKYKGVLHKQDSAELDQSTAELEKFMNSFKQHRSAAQAAKGSGQSGGSERATGSSSKSSGAAAALHTKTVSLIKAKMRQPLGAAGELVASNVLQLHGLASLAPSSLCKGRAKEVSQAVQLAADGCTIVAVDDTVSSQSQDTLGKRQAQAGHAWERAVRSAALPLHDAAVQVGPSEFLFKRQRTDGASHELKVCVQHRAMAPCEELTELPLIVSSDDGPPVQHGLAVSALTATITSASPDPKQILEPFLRAVHTVSTAIAAVERELSSLRQQFPAATFTRLDNLSDQALVVVANVNSQTGWEAPGIAVHLPPTYPSSFPPIRPAVYAASPTSQRNPVVQELKARCNTVDASEGLSGILRTWAAVACSTHNK